MKLEKPEFSLRIHERRNGQNLRIEKEFLSYCQNKMHHLTFFKRKVLTRILFIRPKEGIKPSLKPCDSSKEEIK